MNWPPTFNAARHAIAWQLNIIENRTNNMREKSWSKKEEKAEKMYITWSTSQSNMCSISEVRPGSNLKMDILRIFGKMRFKNFNGMCNDHWLAGINNGVLRLICGFQEFALAMTVKICCHSNPSTAFQTIQNGIKSGLENLTISWKKDIWENCCTFDKNTSLTQFYLGQRCFLRDD